MSIAATWGTTPEERALPFPCGRFLQDADAAYYRGVSVNARPTVVFRWLCQLRAAPHSYDWIDNFGRRSPQALTPGLEDLAVGEPVMRIFTLADFERDRHITCLTKSRLFGNVAVTYLVVPFGDSCRLLMKVLVKYPFPPLGWALRLLLPWGDVIMARRQLLNLKALAERDARVGVAPVDA